MKSSRIDEVVVVPDNDFSSQETGENQEDGVEVPLERINADTLRNLIAEFVTREWEELGYSRYTLDDKINQVRRQLEEKKARVVFDLRTNTCNIVVSEGNRHV